MRKYRFKCVYDDGIHDFTYVNAETKEEAFRASIIIMNCKKSLNADINHIDVYDVEKAKLLFTYYK